VDGLGELLDLGLNRGLIDKTGNHHAFGGSALGNGRERSRDALAASPEIQLQLRHAIVAAGPVKPGRRTEAES
jgi:recombination protein RecA